MKHGDLRARLEEEAADRRMSPEDATILWVLRNHWEDAYVIKLTDGIWSASPIANLEVTHTADTAIGLRTQMQNRYAEFLAEKRVTS